MDIQPQSTPERIAASITRVVDSLGNSIPNPGTTQDTDLILSGSGTANSVVFIYDSGVLLTTASVTINGTWSFTETVVLGRHVFTVRDSLGGADSPEWVVTVGEAELELPKPLVIQAPGGSLNPMDAIDGATVVVTYAMQTTDTIGLSWNGFDDLVPPQQGSTLGSVTFTIPPAAVAAVIGKTIPVLYAVVRNGVAKPSEALSLTVQTLADSVLEAPRILQAPDNMNLDVAALTADADLRVKPWPFIAAGQLISLRFEGTKADGSAHNWPHRTWQNLPISSTGEPATTVGVNNLKTLKDGSSLRLIFEVALREDVKISFPERLYRVVSYSRTEDFDLVPAQTIALGAVVETPAMTLEFMAGDGIVNISKYPSSPTFSPVPGQMDGNTLVTSLNHRGIQLIVIKPKAPCSKVTFYYTWVDRSFVRFFDESGSLLREVALVRASGIQFLEISFAKRLERMEIHSQNDWVSYDHFSFLE